MDIEGYEGKYEISNKGNVRSRQPRYVINKGFVSRDPYLMKPMDNGRGYKYIFLSGHGFRDRRYIHRLVAMHFLPQKDEYSLTVNHKDGDKSNNTLSNLEWMTQSENNQHARETGLCDQKGAKGPRAKLTDLQATAIKRLYNNKLMDPGEIMQVFGIDRHTMINISNNKIYEYLD